MGVLGEEGSLARLVARARRPLGRLVLRREGRLGDLDRLGRGTSARAAQATPDGGDTPSGPRVLVVSLRAWTAHNVYESVLAQALRLRGAQVAMLTCGGGQPLCELGRARRAWPRPCDRCGWYTDRIAGAARMPHYRLADGLPWGGDARRAPVEPPPSADSKDPFRVSEISVPWMLKSTDVEASHLGAVMERDFAVAAAGVSSSIERALDDFHPDIVVMLNGLFASERVIREAALARDCRVVSYEIGLRANSLVFSAGTPAPRYDTDGAWPQFSDRPLGDRQASAIVGLLAARTEGNAAHVRYYNDPVSDAGHVRAALDVPAGDRVISMFTNLAWDSAALGCDIGYDSMFDWMSDVVHTVAELDHTTLVVRVHPAEERWGTMQPATEALGRLPDNVRVIGPDQPLSSYALLDFTDLALTYTTTVGLEAATQGRPIAVAGATHYRGRGFTYDLDSPAELHTLLRSGGWRIDDDQVELAIRYAFMFFFRVMVPFPAVRLKNSKDGVPDDFPNDPDGLRPGVDPYLDFVCERILDGGDFILPDELALPDQVGADG